MQLGLIFHSILPKYFFLTNQEPLIAKLIGLLSFISQNSLGRPQEIKILRIIHQASQMISKSYFHLTEDQK